MTIPIFVVGGGVMGLAAAGTLSRRGQRVTVFEQGARAESPRKRGR